MSRLIPWRNKPTPTILQTISQAKQSKLYLLNQTGPTSFVFKDDQDQKFKVSIGLKLLCSCKLVQNDHCVHTLFVLLKKYKVDQKNPMIWQGSYLDGQLEAMIQFKYSQKRTQPTHKFIRKNLTENINITNNTEFDFPKLQGDQTCPICYQQLKDDAYSQCKQCHNCLHSKCLKVWTKHKQQSQSPVTCPFCRAEFSNPMQIVLKDIQKWNNHFLIHKKTKCKGCGKKNLIGLIYQCLICQNVKLCKLCYQANCHKEHQKYVMKQKSENNWIPAIPRIKDKEYDKNMDINLYLLSVFPTVRQSNKQQYSNNILNLNVVGNQVRQKQLCYKCNKRGNEQMRKLVCGHHAHEQCLFQMIIQKQYLCPIDNENLIKGYCNAMGIKINKKVKQNEQSSKINIFQSSNKTRLKKQSIQIKSHNPLEQQFNPLTINSVINNKANQKSNKNIKIQHSLRAFRIKKNLIQKREQVINKNKQDLPMIITGVQHGNERGKSILRQRNI